MKTGFVASFQNLSLEREHDELVGVLPARDFVGRSRHVEVARAGQNWHGFDLGQCRCGGFC